MTTEVRLKAPWSGSSAMARLHEDGSIELELFDYSQEAQQCLGNDVAWIYRIEAAQAPRLRDRLAVADTHGVLEAFARDFAHLRAVVDWLRTNHIPFTEEFDGRA